MLLLLLKIINNINIDYNIPDHNKIITRLLKDYNKFENDEEKSIISNLLIKLCETGI